VLNSLQSTKQSIRGRLADNFDTFGAVSVLLDLVKATNIYVTVEPGKPANRCPILLDSIVSYINKLLSTFGFEFHSRQSARIAGGDLLTGAALDPRATKILDATLNFRRDVRREMLRSRGGTGSLAVDWKGVLKAADKLRDEVLPDVGVIVKVRLELLNHGPTRLNQMLQDTTNDAYTVTVLDQAGVQQLKKQNESVRSLGWLASIAQLSDVSQ